MVNIWIREQARSRGITVAATDGRSYTSFTKRLPLMVNRFGGQYVAMVDGRVVAHGKDAKQVYDRARRTYPKGRIFLGQVPTKQAMVLFQRRDSFDGRFVEQDYPYPGRNLFSLASGGAIYIRDPYRRASSDQLNGGRQADFTAKDWDLIRPYLQENEKLFGISVKRDLLVVRDTVANPSQVYRKIEPISLQELA